MSLDYNTQQFNTPGKNTDLIDCKCSKCSETYQRTRLNIKASIRFNKQTMLCETCRKESNKTGVNINCKNCNKEFYSTNKRFCTQSCAAIYNNSHRTCHKHSSKTQILPKILKETKSKSKLTESLPRLCKFCNSLIETSYGKRHGIFCSALCASKYRHKVAESEIFNKIEKGETTFGSSVRNDSWWFKRYLILKYGEKCMKCGWEQRNIYTNRIPIELEHKDGNCDNNALSNLELLCPNCHSLTPTYKGANKNKNKAGSSRYKYWKKSFSNRSDVIKLDLT